MWAVSRAIPRNAILGYNNFAQVAILDVRQGAMSFGYFKPLNEEYVNSEHVTANIASTSSMKTPSYFAFK
jgi:hypothetical protein